VAYRHVAEHPNATVCVFELSHRVGGRVHSLRHQGPQSDLVVEAGAYRFAPNKTCIHRGNFSLCLYTPLTAALIMDALKLPSKRYNPAPGQYDSGLLKIIDPHTGHDAGYLSFVEAMLAQTQTSATPTAEASTFSFLPFHEVVSIAAETGKPLSVTFASGASATCDKLVLNVPQRPLMRLLAASPTLTPTGSPWPKVLNIPSAFPLLKLYVHYEDAWWINSLGLRSGHFNNSALWHAQPANPMQKDDCIASHQAPLPVQGSYHDGDVRCDLSGGKCRGFLQAAYMGDVQAVRAYEQYHLSGNDSVVTLDPKAPHHAHLLSEIHETLIALHEAPLKAAGAYDHVKGLAPSGGVLSIWSQRVAGIETGCHIPKVGPPIDPADVPRKALRPLADQRIWIANEAFGPIDCWAEGSLIMAENVAHQLGLGKPKWLPQPIYDKVIFPSPDAVGEAPIGSTPHEGVASDLLLVEHGI